MDRKSTLKLSSPEQGFWEISVLYEDEQMLALNKPPLLLSSPDRLNPERPSLMQLVHRGISQGAPWARERKITYLMNAHRLDFETSGVMLLAKSKPALVALANLFGSDKPIQTYVALVQGVPEKDSFRVDAKLAPHPTRPEIVRVDEQRGKRSRTEFAVRERFRGFALIECRPLVLRPHQIRVHLKHTRHPIVGDTSYGGKPLLLSRLKADYRLKPGHEERPLIAMAALHAEKLSIAHPVTGEAVEITAAWPKDFTVAVKYLRRYGT